MDRETYNKRMTKMCKCGELMPASYFMCNKCKEAAFNFAPTETHETPTPEEAAELSLKIKAAKKELRYLNTKIRRAKKYKEGDTDIDLRKVYAKDGGLCWICGKMCDWGDFKNDGSFVNDYGPKYPTIDHVKPLSKGGEHKWENVRLACFDCNIKKGAKMNYSQLKAI